MPSEENDTAKGDDDSLGEAFWSVARQLRHRSVETFAPLGITPGHGRAINVLMRHGSMRLSDLAIHLRIAPRSATEVADALADRGLVSREPDPGDRRATLVALTDEGRAVGDQAKAGRMADTEAFFSRLTDQDRATLAHILRKLR